MIDLADPFLTLKLCLFPCLFPAFQRAFVFWPKTLHPLYPVSHALLSSSYVSHNLEMYIILSCPCLTCASNIYSVINYQSFHVLPNLEAIALHDLVSTTFKDLFNFHIVLQVKFYLNRL